MPGSLESQEKQNHPLTDGSGGRAPAQSDTWADLARREIHLVGAGLTGFGHAASEAFNRENLPTTVGKIALSVGLAFTLGRLRPVSAVGQQLLRSAGLATGLGFGMDIATNSWQVGKAMADAATANPQWDKDVSVMQNSLGKFAFDTALTAPFAIGASTIGARLGAGKIAAATASETHFARTFASARSDAEPDAALAARKYNQLLSEGYAAPPLMALIPDLNRSIYSVMQNSPPVTNQRYGRVLDQLRGSLNDVHRANGLPDIGSLKSATMGDLGDHVFGNIRVNSKLFRDVFEYPSPYSLSRDQARLASIVLHEDQHLADEALVIRRLADKLGVGRDPQPSDMQAIFKLHPHGAETDWWKNDDFVKQALSRAPEAKLTSDEIRRADLLLDSLRLPLMKGQPGTPAYPEWPHEAYAFAVEGRAFDTFNSVHGKSSGSMFSRGGVSDLEGFGEPVRRFLSG